MPKQLVLTKTERALVQDYRRVNRFKWTEAIEEAEHAAEFCEMSAADRGEIKRQLREMRALRREGADYYTHQGAFGLVNENGVAWDE